MIHRADARPALLLVLLAAAPVPAPRAGAQGVPVPATRFTEHWNDTVRVASSGVRVGLMASGADERFDPRTFVLFVPAGARVVCVSVISEDGRYAANAEYRPAPGLRGRVLFALPTRLAGQLSVYHAREVAILASVAASCATRESYFVVASWNALQPWPLVLLLNAREPSARALLSTPDTPGESEVTCPEMSDPRTIAFNRACRITAPIVAKRALIRIQRATTRLLPEVQVPLSLP